MYGHCLIAVLCRIGQHLVDAFRPTTYCHEREHEEQNDSALPIDHRHLPSWRIVLRAFVCQRSGGAMLEVATDRSPMSPAREEQQADDQERSRNHDNPIETLTRRKRIECGKSDECYRREPLISPPHCDDCEHE